MAGILRTDKRNLRIVCGDYWHDNAHGIPHADASDGFPLSRVAERRFHVGDFQYSAYLKSPFVAELNKTGQLELAEMHPALNDAVDEAQETIKTYFSDRAAERARSVVEEWKEAKDDSTARGSYTRR